MRLSLLCAAAALADTSAFPIAPAGAQAAPQASASAPKYSTAKNDLATLFADPKARAVLDKYLPGLSEVARTANVTLLTYISYAGGSVPDPTLRAIDAELAEIRD